MQHGKQDWGCLRWIDLDQHVVVIAHTDRGMSNHRPRAALVIGVDHDPARISGENKVDRDRPTSGVLIGDCYRRGQVHLEGYIHNPVTYPHRSIVSWELVLAHRPGVQMQHGKQLRRGLH